jgi:type I restriction enzyme S subunit
MMLNSTTQWMKVNLGDLVDLINGRGFKSSEWSNNGLPIIRISNLNGDNRFNFYGGDYDEKHFVKPSDLLFSWSGNRGTSFGPYIWKGNEGLLNQHIFKVVPNKRVSKQFLYYQLSRLTVIIENTAHGGSGLVHVKKTDLVNFTLDLPPLTEQSRIADILTTVDNTISKTEAIINQTEKVKKGLMQQLLTKGIGHTKFKQTEIGEIPEEWEVSSINELLIEYRGGASLSPNDFTHNGFRVLPKKGITPSGNLDIKEEDLTFTSYDYAQANSKSVVDNSYLITTLRDLVPKGPSIGRIVRILDENQYILAQGVYGFKIKGKLDGQFLSYVSNSQYFRNEMMKKKVGSTQVHIRNMEYFNTLIPLPNINEQRGIVRVLSSFDQMISNEKRKLEKLQFLKKGIMQVLLTGKVRVKVNDQEVI